MTFTIDDQGKVTKASAKGVDASIEGCITTVLESIEYPKPTKADMVEARFPITYSAPPP